MADLDEASQQVMKEAWATRMGLSPEDVHMEIIVNSDGTISIRMTFLTSPESVESMQMALRDDIADPEGLAAELQAQLAQCMDCAAMEKASANSITASVSEKIETKATLTKQSIDAAPATNKDGDLYTRQLEASFSLRGYTVLAFDPVVQTIFTRLLAQEIRVERVAVIITEVRSSPDGQGVDFDIQVAVTKIEEEEVAFRLSLIFYHSLDFTRSLRQALKKAGLPWTGISLSADARGGGKVRTSNKVVPTALPGSQTEVWDTETSKGMTSSAGDNTEILQIALIFLVAVFIVVAIGFLVRWHRMQGEKRRYFDMLDAENDEYAEDNLLGEDDDWAGDPAGGDSGDTGAGNQI